MSVRDGLLAILTVGPAYGHQLHAEFRLRAAHRGPVNVGQIYTTLDRLTKQKLIELEGATDDGLPLHRLTTEGRRTATAWMSVPVDGTSADWTEMLDQLLITSTIDVDAARVLVDRFEHRWQVDLAAAVPSPSGTPVGRAASAARRVLAAAAIDWLDQFRSGLDDDAAFGFAESRPRRGRRPGVPIVDGVAVS